MRIGDLAKRVGTTTRSLRYYEELGIIEPETKTEGGFRLYSEKQIRRIEIINHLKSLGFSLSEISKTMNMRKRKRIGDKAAKEAIGNLEIQLKRIESKISDCVRMMKEVEESIEVIKGCLGCEEESDGRSCRECDVFLSEGGLPIFTELMLG
jgi:DNA-binding transcriptional MerR regulator